MKSQKNHIKKTQYIENFLLTLHYEPKRAFHSAN